MFVGPSAAAINLNVDGSAAVVTSGVEIGSGTMVQATPQIVAAELGPPSRRRDRAAGGHGRAWLGRRRRRWPRDRLPRRRQPGRRDRGARQLLRDVQSLPVRSASPAGRSTRPGFQRLAHPRREWGWRNGREVIQDGCGGIDRAESPGVKGGGLSGAGTDFGPPSKGFIGDSPVIARVLAELPRGDIHPTFVFHDGARGFLNASWRRPMGLVGASVAGELGQTTAEFGDLIDGANLYRQP